MQLFDRNYTSLITQNSNVDESSLDLDEARSRSKKSTLSIDSKAWFEASNVRACVLPQLMPRSRSVAEDWRKISEPYQNLDCLDKYIDLHEDPHTYSILSDFYFKLEEIGADPDDFITVETSPIPGLICLGTGNGDFLLQLIRRYRPYKIIIIVTEWEDIISSFDTVDWTQLFEDYSSIGYDIRICRIKPDKTELLAQVTKFGIMCVDHSYIYTPESSNPELYELKQYLSGREMENLLLYQGYTVDEYNMIINTARFYTHQPKIYQSPESSQTKATLVVGSGPSLDASIDIVRQLQKSHTIICGGSNYRTLLSHGIDPDYLVLVERADEVYDSYNSIRNEYGDSNTRLVLSSTCNHRLVTLFDEVCLFFRPALSPLVLFGESDDQIVTHEGPQAVCAAISFALNLQPELCTLVGVDLGSSDSKRQRSAFATGYSPREWTDTVDGNLTDLVFTDRRLLDCRDMIEYRIASIRETQETRIINISDGVKLQGAEPMLPQDYTSNFKALITSANALSSTDSWWDSLSVADPKRTSKLIALRRPREKTLGLINRLRKILLDPTIPWFPTLVALFEDELNLIGVDPQAQLPIRLIKATIMKAVVSVSQQFIIMDKDGLDPQHRLEFGAYAKERILQQLDIFESEIFLLTDLLDSTLSLDTAFIQ